MDNLILLVQDDTIVTNPEWIDRNEYIDMDNENSTHTYKVYPSYYENIAYEGLEDLKIIGCKFVHKDCYKYYKQVIGKELKYSDIDMIEYYNIPENDNKNKLYPTLNKNLLNLKSFDEIQKKYCSEDYGFLIGNIIIDNKLYLLESPLKSTQNRIKPNKKQSRRNFWFKNRFFC